jgi:predicted peptidase
MKQKLFRVACSTVALLKRKKVRMAAGAQALVLAGATAFSGCSTTETSTAPDTQPNQMAKNFVLKTKQTIEVKYLLFLPKGYSAKSAKTWPLILFLHGAGERGTNVWKVATHGPPKNVVEHPDFPFIVVSPQCPEGELWSNETLLALLDEITRSYAVDTTRVYLTGLSMGGYGTWSLGVSHPERFAAMAPICGGGEMISILLASRDKAPALKTLGVWAFHGAKDPVVPVEESQRMVDAMKKIGAADVKFTIYPEAGHNSWTEAYKDPELYKWFLEHQRKPARRNP